MRIRQLTLQEQHAQARRLKETEAMLDAASGSASRPPETCPHCGAGQSYQLTVGMAYACNTTWVNGAIYRRDERCYEEERAAIIGDGVILAMRLLQSDIVLDDDERAAMDRFMPRPQKPNEEVSDRRES